MANNKLDLQKITPGAKVRLSDFDPGQLPSGLEDKAIRVAALNALSTQLDALQDVFYAARSHKLLLVLQGMDTAGKDATIQHVFRTVNPLGVRVATFKQPTEIERAHDFLWRVHSEVPADGEIAIFNRSHYEDVLVSVVHGWIDASECKQRYVQINHFEKLLVNNRTTVIKCILHISKDVQRDRLIARFADPAKRWKLSAADLAERKLWKEYERAYARALSATSTDFAPWFVIPSNSKSSRNLLIAQLLVNELTALKLKYPQATLTDDQMKID